MDAKGIKSARAAANKFLRTVQVYSDSVKNCDQIYAIICGTKETGAMRRASMDLTRALAEMRKAN